MNVLIIPSFIFNKSNPTSGSFFLEQAEALRRKGHNVFLLFCDTYSVKEFHHWFHYEEKNEVKQGIPVYRKRAFCPLKHGSGFYGCHERFAKEIIALYQEHLADKKIDIIHAHCCSWAGYAAMKLSEETGIPYVITEHSAVYEDKGGRIKGKYEAAIKQAFSGAKRVICVSRDLAKRIAPYAPNATVVGNVIDCEIYKPGERSSDPGGITFLTVLHMGNPAALTRKGIDLLLNAFEKVIDKYPTARLLIGGGGTASHVLESWIIEKNLTENVTMLGPLSRQEVAQQMQQCDVFVLPSLYETFGVVYAEAMACGKPVIATRTDGPPSFVTEDTGILIDVGSQEQLNQAVLYMAENYSQYNSTVIREHIAGQFSMEAIGNQLTQIYEG